MWAKRAGISAEIMRALGSAEHFPCKGPIQTCAVSKPGIDASGASSDLEVDASRNEDDILGRVVTD